MRSIKFPLTFIFLFAALLCIAQTDAHAAFVLKGIVYTTPPSVDSPTKARVTIPDEDTDMDTPLPAHKQKHHTGNSFLAWFAVACGVAGILFSIIPAVLFMYLFGLTAGVTGSNGLKKYKHAKFLHALCYVGIILGAIAVVLATIPILLLL